MKNSLKTKKTLTHSQGKDVSIANQYLPGAHPKILPKHRLLNLPPKKCSYPSCKETELYKDGLCLDHYQYEHYESK